ncbi:hypothetical protein WOSG25_250010 [Weissella oryzae SG25]|uniref:SHOCT domain-containing protein n=1 Tax=Weissella oryzae (strain DSM 25784 / JCM 18191 / LMG 30913 / SG25) TaxID=1329250 RepID=A0A069CW49_WEIOS|nr:DUF4428 domain-containing protein [Weissella oryzae]GAK32030.1 hypothetical protein WOSG25_250010 [Weissella oryzae SG25]
MAKQICPICNETKMGFFNSEKIKDGKICENCEIKLGLKFASGNYEILKELTINHAKEMIENGKIFDYSQEKTNRKREKQQAKDNYVAEKQKTKEAEAEAKAEYDALLQSFKDNKAYKIDGIYIDQKSKRFFVPQTLLRSTMLEPFSNFVDYEPVLRTNSKTKHHGLTRAVVGGIALGGVGAIVGASTGHKDYSIITKMSLILRFSDNKTYEIKYINSETKVGLITNGLEKQMNELATVLENILAENKTSEPNELPSSNSLADELTKLANLKDAGILTEDEFNQQKAKLLNN